MVKSMFAGVAGLRAHQQKMDVIGNNIANVNTWGFKGATVSFKESMYQTVIQSSAGSANKGALGGTNSSQVGYGAQFSSIKQNFTQGNYSPTDSPLDCMINGSGFFLVGTHDGNEEGDIPLCENANNLKLSRVGDFEMKAILEGTGDDAEERTYLTDSSGYLVYGVAVEDEDGTGDGIKLSQDVKGDNLKYKEDETELRALRIPKAPVDDDGKEDKFASFTIDETGVLTGTTESGASYVVGRIVIGSVPNPGGLTNQAGAYYQVYGSSGEVQISDAGGAIGSLVTNGLEMALVDLSTEMSNMITTQRGFQANSKIITVTDEMLEQLVNMKR